uniref:Galactose mutarotase N-terminal barrel domain-containing protein n=3 Tax=Parascaris univalens TaxID=6257 RepID=A0A915ASA5_PARUN
VVLWSSQAGWLEGRQVSIKVFTSDKPMDGYAQRRDTVSCRRPQMKMTSVKVMRLTFTAIIGVLCVPFTDASIYLTIPLRLRLPGYGIDCIPERKQSVLEAECFRRGCIWDNSTVGTAPECTFPSNTGFVVEKVVGGVTFLRKNRGGARNPYGQDLQLSFIAQRFGAALNVRITDRENTRFKTTSYVEFAYEKSKSSDRLVIKQRESGFFYFTVVRKSTGAVIWDTSIGGLLFADQYIQIATKLPTSKIYGFGENIHQTLKHDFTNYTTWGMFARDEFPNSRVKDGKNLYGVHGFYLGLEKDNKAHGVLILNSNAQEVTTMPGPALVFRTIGGMLDLYFFPGPTPEEVIQQYLALVGKPALPAYYALGFQLCRYGYKNLDHLKSVVEEVRNASIPLDVIYADIDYMDRYNDFSVGEQWSGLNEYIKAIRKDGIRTFLIFDCGIRADDDAFARALQRGAAFIEWERVDQVPRHIQDMYPKANNTKIMLAVVWPDGHTAFPDFYDEEGVTAAWWIEEFVKFHRESLQFDGIWIDMNEPAAFGTNEERPWYFDYADHPNITSLRCPLTGTDSHYDSPPFKTFNVYTYGDNAHLSTKTLCMLAMTARGKARLYDTKSLYGLAETVATFDALHASTGKRGAVISRSTFPSSGRYGGHWLGDNSATWEDLRTAVIGVQEFNMFGIPYVGSDICGFLGDSNEELCLRWHQLGAFHPFARNHNDRASKAHHPTVWPFVADATRNALHFRYYYLPYLYSLHFEASLYGGTVVRPVFFEFPEDEHTHDLSYQFLWGSSIMFLPVVYQGASVVDAYIPNAVWYSIRQSDYGNVIDSGMRTFDAPLHDMIPVLVRGGSIILRQEPSVSTFAARQHTFDLLIALDEKQQASGRFYWDEGEDIVTSFEQHSYFHWTANFSVIATHAVVKVVCKKGSAGGVAVPRLDKIDILGYKNARIPNYVFVNGKRLFVDTVNDHNTLLIVMPKIRIASRSTTIMWSVVDRKEGEESDESLSTTSGEKKFSENANKNIPDSTGFSVNGKQPYTEVKPSPFQSNSVVIQANLINIVPWLVMWITHAILFFDCSISLSL